MPRLPTSHLFSSVCGHTRHLCIDNSSSHFNVLFLMGGPGAGKGTQSTLLTEEFGCCSAIGPTPTDASAPIAVDVRREHERLFLTDSRDNDSKVQRKSLIHLSIGALLRREMRRKEGHSEAIRVAIEQGAIVPGSITVSLLKREMQRLSAEMKQREPGNQNSPCFLIDGFPRSNENVNKYEQGIGRLHTMAFLQCTDKTLMQRLTRRAQDGTMISRSDDTEFIINARLKTFQQVSMPVINDWSNHPNRVLHVINGESDILTVYRQLRQIVQHCLGAKIMV